MSDKTDNINNVDLNKGWISVSERLPKESELVLVTEGDCEINIDKYEKGKWWWLADACADYWKVCETVTAWLPLPKPYKAKSEAEKMTREESKDMGRYDPYTDTFIKDNGGRE